ncbi:hypothetical protein [Winogradskyella sp.]|uniref:hypothetical protein n=1 Tax=Winogradskyella sp. TaxID=1883156 RepID=UPI00260D60F3|nr:hypothetical protein [Winogradskyella sp.]
MKQERVNFSRKSGKINGWNQVHGIKNNNILYLLICVIFCVTHVNSQEKIINEVVTEILGTNKFSILQKSDSSPIILQLNDTDSLPKNHSKHSKAIQYLESKILNKDVYVHILGTNDKIYNGSITYDCIPNNDKETRDEQPCLSSNFLDLELIKYGYIIYKGDNEFLKRMGNASN